MIISGGKALGFAPQALGETTPSFSNGYFFGTTGMNLSGLTATYGALYRAQPSIATVVDKVAASAARLTVKVWDNTPANGRVVDTDSAFARLIANPCLEMSTFNFYRWTVATYEIYGEAFWLKVRGDDGKVASLLPMHPARTMVKRDDNGKTWYVFTLGVASAGILTVPEEDVVAFLRYNPDSLMRGLSRLEPLRSTLLNEDASRRATQSWWKRGARPSVVLTHPGELSQGATDRLRAGFDARHAGADNMGGTNVLEEGMNLQVIQLNAEEMQYIESRKLNMQEVCMVYDVPPPVVHILDHATFSNITEQMRSMYRDTMSPRLEDFESTIDRSLRSEFYAPGEREAEFDMAEVLRGDFESRVDKAMAGRQSGMWSGNTALEIVGMSKSEDPEMNKIYANAALVPLGSAPQVAASAPADPGVVPALADKAVTVRTVMGKLARVRDDPGAIREKIAEEHVTALNEFFKAQLEAVKADLVSSKSVGAKSFDQKVWDLNLRQILFVLAEANAKARGNYTASQLGGSFNEEQVKAWLMKNSGIAAERINRRTAEDLVEAYREATGADAMIAASIQVFETKVAERVEEIAISRATSVGEFASSEAAKQNGARMKTWMQNPSKTPRASHTAMSGETVESDGVFSNGMKWPGDPSGNSDEIAGCKCTLTFSKEG